MAVPVETNLESFLYNMNYFLRLPQLCARRRDRQPRDCTWSETFQIMIAETRDFPRDRLRIARTVTSLFTRSTVPATEAITSSLST